MKPVTGIILSGGQSSRMGSDKGFVLFKGKPLIEHALKLIRPLCREILISANHEDYRVYGYPVINDTVQSIGPLGGISSCLPLASFQNVFITGCDIPEISDDILQEMFDMLMKYDMISLRLPNNRIQPLPLGMSKKALPIIEMQLNSGHFALHDLIMACQTYPEMTSAVINIEKSPVNINTIADLNNYETP